MKIIIILYYNIIIHIDVILFITFIKMLIRSCITSIINNACDNMVVKLVDTDNMQ
jgi:hypothetical protein